MSENQKGFAAFLAKKDIVFSAKRYGIDALGAMAQGLFASLLIGTILKTLGQQLGVAILVDIGTFAQAVTGPAMAVSIGYALKCPPLVLFSLIAVGGAANQLGGAGGPLAVFVVTIFAAEFGKLVSKETKVDIIVTPSVTICGFPCGGHPPSVRRQVQSAMPSSGQRSCSPSSWGFWFPLSSASR